MSSMFSVQEMSSTPCLRSMRLIAMSSSRFRASRSILCTITNSGRTVLMSLSNFCSCSRSADRADSPASTYSSCTVTPSCWALA
ncbi:hypothetical protein DV26_44880 [Amycolatopsis mediterranei]|nr:hypothetical protein DV26_44880 [Amycolatopsis mediterranei]